MLKTLATSDISLFILGTHVQLCVKARGELVGVGSLLLPCGSGESNSGHQIWQQALQPLDHLSSPAVQNIDVLIISFFVYQYSATTA